MARNIRSGSVPAGTTEMEYATFGSGDRNLIVLPGLSDGLATVKGKALLLAKPYLPVLEEFTVTMFSRINDMPEGYSMRDMAEDQWKVLDAMGIRTCSVLGVSQGGMIAQCLAASRPERMEKLILAVTAPRANDLVKDCVTRWMEDARRGDHRQLMIDTAEDSYSPERLKKYRKMYPLLGAVGRPRSYDRFFANGSAILSFDIEKDLERITCPTLILGGEEDRIVGAEASRELHARIPGSELFLYPGLGHAAYEEAPDFYSRVFEFLNRDMQT